MNNIIFFCAFCIAFGLSKPTTNSVSVEIINIDNLKYNVEGENRRFLQASPYPNEIEVRLGKTLLAPQGLTLNLKKNIALFGKSYTEKTVSPDGTTEKLLGTANTHGRNCHYQGTIEGHESSMVALSTCNGEHHGWIQTENHDQLVLSKILSTTTTKEQELASDEFSLKRFYDTIPEELRNSYFDLPGKTFGSFAAELLSEDLEVKTATNADSRRNLSTGTKYVETFVFNDPPRIASFGGTDDQSLNITLKDCVDQAVAVMNLVGGFYTQTQAQDGGFEENIVVMVSGMFLMDQGKEPYHQELVSKNVFQSNDEVAHRDLLETFLDWCLDEYEMGEMGESDNRVLLSGHDFMGGAVGVAKVGSMCNLRYSGSINMCQKGNDVTMCALTVAHEMGHNFGISHDNTNGRFVACKSQNTHIMSSHIGLGSSGVFSTCSVQYLDYWFHNNYGPSVPRCLENKGEAYGGGEPYCGNGIVEEGEDCDCGDADGCPLNPCCGANCRFSRSSYQCAAGECCDLGRCMFQSHQHMCRGSADANCDQAEYCVGNSATCPTNIFAYPGTECSFDGKSGTCYAGKCNTLQEQCQTVGIGSDYTELCATHNDQCTYPVCHLSSQPDTTDKCHFAYQIDNVMQQINDGMECWHRSMAYDDFTDPQMNTRRGICYKQQCVLPHVAAHVPLCGNGAIDYGEQCDCGKDGESGCDCSTCQRQGNRVCSSRDPCCTSSGQYASSSTVCRASVDSQCDIAERCTGTSSKCPRDRGQSWETTCTRPDGDSSTCYAKRCIPSLNEYCQVKFNTDQAWVYSRMSKNSCSKHYCCRRPGSCSPSGSKSSLSSSQGVLLAEYKWDVAPLGSMMNDPDARCMHGDEVQLIKRSSDCHRTTYFEESIGDCLPCDDSCHETCTGPTQFDCSDGCAFGHMDANGACPISEAQAAFLREISVQRTNIVIQSVPLAPPNQCVDENNDNICDENANCVTRSNLVQECECDASLGFQGGGTSCTRIHSCGNSADLCPLHSVCVDTETLFTCDCRTGYVKVNGMCEKELRDECADGSNTCTNDSTCVNLDDGYKCNCPVGYRGDGLISGTGCQNVNECADKPCGANMRCEDNEGSFACLCLDGFDLSTDIADDGCVDENECETDPMVCGNNAQCTNVLNGEGYTCSCDDGYRNKGTNGNHFCGDINECAEDVNICGSNASCDNKDGFYECNCFPGYEEKGNGQCGDIDECDTSGPSVCGLNSICANSVGSYSCSCMDGYEMDNGNCVLIPVQCNIGSISDEQAHWEADCGVLDEGEYCKIACAEGYDGKPTTVRCSNGIMGSQRPFCFEKSCIVGIMNGDGYSKNCGQVLHGHSCTVGCSTGFVGNSETTTCAFGNSVGNEPTCVAQSCAVGTIQSDAWIGECNTVSAGSTCTLACKDGYLGDSVDVQCYSGVFGSERPYCYVEYDWTFDFSLWNDCQGSCGSGYEYKSAVCMGTNQEIVFSASAANSLCTESQPGQIAQKCTTTDDCSLDEGVSCMNVFGNWKNGKASVTLAQDDGSCTGTGLPKDFIFEVEGDVIYRKATNDFDSEVSGTINADATTINWKDNELWTKDNSPDGPELIPCEGDYFKYNGGYGGCQTYTQGKINHLYCDDDGDESAGSEGFVASVVCPECLRCFLVLSEVSVGTMAETPAGMCEAGSILETGILGNCKSRMFNGDSCNLHCDPMKYTGNEVRVTCADGVFGSERPTCEPKKCSVGIVKGHGYWVACNSVLHGESCTVSCKSGFEGDSTQLSCDHGKALGTTPQCEAPQCQGPGQTLVGDGYSKECGAMESGTHCQVSCSYGYSGTAEMVACNLGVMETNRPTCIVDHEWTFTGAQFGACDVSCGKGYQTKTQICKGKDGTLVTGTNSAHKLCSGQPDEMQKECDAGMCDAMCVNVEGIYEIGGGSTASTISLVQPSQKCTGVADPKDFSFTVKMNQITRGGLNGISGTIDTTGEEVTQITWTNGDVFVKQTSVVTLSVPVVDPRQCDGDQLLTFGYGNCLTYVEGRTNHKYCATDDSDGGLLAINVCPQCLGCQSDQVISQALVEAAVGTTSHCVVGMFSTLKYYGECLERMNDGDICNVYCADDYEVDSDEADDFVEVACTNGMFGSNRPTCIKKGCPAKTASGDGYSTACAAASHGRQCEIACNADLEGVSLKLQCLYGKWEGQVPNCWAKTCPITTIQGTGYNVDCPSISNGEKCIVGCSDGFTGTAQEVFCDKGAFLTNVPVCKAIAVKTQQQSSSPSDQSDKPACKGSRNHFDAGWDGCHTYVNNGVLVGMNHEHCSDDVDRNEKATIKYLAEEVCPECGKCNSNERSIAVAERDYVPRTKKSKRHSNYLFYGSIFLLGILFAIGFGRCMDTRKSRMNDVYSNLLTMEEDEI